MKGKQIRVSVRNLVEFVLRSGDIDNRRTAIDQKEAMLAGGRIHRKIQKKMGSGYQSEMVLKCTVEEDGFEILVEGRADGIIREGNRATIDEIKGVYMDIGDLEEAVEIHLAQAMCYGYFYGSQENLDELTIQVTYCNLDTEEIRRFQVIKTTEELKEWFIGLIHEYVKWARYLHHNAKRRDESLKELEFPFPYREGQRELAVSVYRTEARRRKLFIQAPTGIGKTLSTVFPSLKAIGEGHGDKLFYLTAKTITRGVAEEAFAILRERGLYFRSVTITAKDKLCFLDKPECNPDACPYAKGHFDRVNDAVYEIVHKEFGITRDVILRYAEKFQVCPFEFCLDISSFVDGIICDYNYVFDPDVRLKRYFADGAKGEYIFLIDEAHNLVPRAREMYSAALIKEDVLAAKRLVKEKSAGLTKQLERVNKILLEMKRDSEGWQILPDADHLVTALTSLFSVLEKFMDDYKGNDGREELLDFYFCVRNFLNIYERVDEHYRIYTELTEYGNFMIKLLCVNPIVHIGECLAQGNSTVFFSATLLPIRYYRQLLSNDEEDYTVYVNSPFPQENRLLLAATDVTSRYTRRNRAEYKKILEYIRQAAEVKKGNYIVFFPSYQYMNRVLELVDSRRILRPDGEDELMAEAELMVDTQWKSSDFTDFVQVEQSVFDTEKVSGAEETQDAGEQDTVLILEQTDEPGQTASMDNQTEDGIEWLVQGNRMSDSEREDFLKEFEKERDHSLVACCVMGGLFSEGIDLKEERLIGAIIVGTGLPMVCTEQEILKGYFDEEEQEGFAFSYQYPGMNKVMQAAGRVIRTAADKGIILLLDDRFLRNDYRELFPREWSDCSRVTLRTVRKKLEEFWSRR